MTKPSRSPERHTFQKEGYVKRQAEKGETISEVYLEYHNKILKDHEHKFDDPASRENSMEYDLLTTDWILEKVRASEVYAQHLYAAMCNNDFMKNDVWPTLKNQTWSCSWRYAGGIIADMRQQGDYIDWYCSGIKGDADEIDYEAALAKGYDLKAYVSESVVTDEIREDLFKLGWLVVDNPDK